MTTLNCGATHQLDPVKFKVFMYCLNENEHFIDQGSGGTKYEKITEVSTRINLDQDDIREAMWWLRQNGWLDIFALTENGILWDIAFVVDAEEKDICEEYYRLNYERVGEELLEDLQTLCSSCHAMKPKRHHL